MYIICEGVVGVGKTTQSKALASYIQGKNPDREVVRVREPGKAPIAEAIRTLVQGTDFEEKMDPICEAYLYAAARAQLIHTIIAPALSRNAIVVADRSFWSSLAYQGSAKKLGIETIRTINQPIVQACIPDLVLFFDLPVEIGLARTFDATGDKHEREELSFFQDVYAGYLSCIHDTRFAKKSLILDASGTQEEVFERMVLLLQPHLG